MTNHNSLNGILIIWVSIMFILIKASIKENIMTKVREMDRGVVSMLMDLLMKVYGKEIRDMDMVCLNDQTVISTEGFGSSI